MSAGLLLQIFFRKGGGGGRNALNWGLKEEYHNYPTTHPEQYIPQNLTLVVCGSI